MSLYTLDGTTRKLLRLERFGQPDFSVKSFIEQLSGTQSHLDSDRRLDPKPYIRTFESAANELERLHEIALNQEDAASSASAELNESRNLEIQDLVSNVRTTVRDVKALDEVAAEIQQITGLESTKLEQISREHTQISEYRALISAYLSFLSGKPPSELTRLWGTDMRKKAAFVAQLQALATEIGKVDGKPEVQTQIDKYAENLENQLLSNFLESYQNFDLPGMRDCAEILTEFNGGGSVVQAYINQHRFFMNVDQLQQQEESKESLSQTLWEEMVTPQSKYEEFTGIVDKEIKEITDTIARETEIITKVFPKPTQVLSMFIQRTFAQKVQGLVALYMDEAASQPKSSALCQVRVLSVCYAHVNNLVNDLQNSWSKANSSLNDAQQSELGDVLDSNFSDAFVLYKDEYFQLEEQSLSEITENEFRLATGSTGSSENHGGNSAAPSANSLQRSATIAASSGEDGRMDRLRRMWSTRTDTPPAEGDSSASVGSNVSAGNANGATKRGDISINPGSANTTAVEDTTPLSARTPLHARWQKLRNIPISSLHNVLGSFAEAISREQILRSPEQFPADATVLYNLLTHELGGRYISAVIDDALELSYKVDVRTAIDWSFIESIKTSGHALRLVAAFVKTVLFAMVQSSPDSQNNMAVALNTYIGNVQRSCCELTEQTAELMHHRTKYLFSKNTRKDFLEPQDESVIHADLLDEFHNLSNYVKDTLSHDNSYQLLQLVAKNFCDDLLEHIPQFTISMDGGVALSTDIAEFERLMTQEWALSGEVSDRFATLRAISRLYTADQSLLSSLLRDSHLKRLTPSQLRAYLGQRSDNNARLMNMLYFQGSLQHSKRY